MHKVILRNFWFNSIKSQHMYKYTLIFRILDLQSHLPNTSGFSQVISPKHQDVRSHLPKTSGFTQSFAQNIRSFSGHFSKKHQIVHGLISKTSVNTRLPVWTLWTIAHYKALDTVLFNNAIRILLFLFIAFQTKMTRYIVAFQRACF